VRVNQSSKIECVRILRYSSQYMYSVFEDLYLLALKYYVIKLRMAGHILIIVIIILLILVIIISKLSSHQYYYYF